MHADKILTAQICRLIQILFVWICDGQMDGWTDGLTDRQWKNNMSPPERGRYNSDKTRRLVLCPCQNMVVHFRDKMLQIRRGKRDN